MPLVGLDGNNFTPTLLPQNIAIVNDQLVGREILNRFKQTHKSKLLGDIVDVAESVGEPEILEVKFGREVYQFAHTVEQNISSPVYYKDRVGRSLRVLDENGSPVQATNAVDRIEIRAKNKKRLDALAKGQRLKLKDIEVSNQEFQDAITPNEELAINAVVRGMNKHGIVWTDHKMENLDIVSDPKSPLGYKVRFFDFDGFRVVQGNSQEARAKAARDLQRSYDRRVDPSTPDAERPIGDGQLQRQQNAFDFTANGGDFIVQVSSAGANNLRTRYQNYDQMNDGEFNQSLAANSRGRVRGLSESP